MLACRQSPPSPFAGFASPATPLPLPSPSPPRLAAVSDSSSAQGRLLPPGLPEPSSSLLHPLLASPRRRAQPREKEASERAKGEVD